MTDREMLELAAKAAGYIVVGLADDMVAQPGNKAGGLVIRNEHGGDSLWHPRNDDGDALRLAVDLRIELAHNDHQDQYRYVCAHRAGCEMLFDPVSVVEDFEDEDHRRAATRLAITRAAAEIGRNMK